jgi:hypothetical protein
MEEVLREPIELTEFELDAVAGGNPFSNTTGAFASQVTSSQGFAGVIGDVIAVNVAANFNTGIVA